MLQAPRTVARVTRPTPSSAPRRALPSGSAAPRKARKLARDERLDASLSEAHTAWRASLKYTESVGCVRESLPAYAARSTILETLQKHRVVLIAGETGCGKTTQVPQFLLVDAIERGCGS